MFIWHCYSRVDKTAGIVSGSGGKTCLGWQTENLLYHVVKMKTRTSIANGPTARDSLVGSLAVGCYSRIQ